MLKIAVAIVFIAAISIVVFCLGFMLGWHYEEKKLNKSLEERKRRKTK